MPKSRTAVQQNLVVDLCDKAQPYARSNILLISAGDEGLPGSCVCVLLGCNAEGHPVIVADFDKPDVLGHIYAMLEDYC